MVLGRKLLLVLVVFLQVLFAACILGTSVFVIENDRKISTSWYRAWVIHSLNECVAFCQVSEGCTAANYMATERICYLFNQFCYRTDDAPEWKYIRLPSAKRTFHHITNKTKTWNNAKEYCKSIGGGLANIMSPADHKMIWDIISPPKHNRAWIGGSDIDREGDWIWTNGCNFNDQDFEIWRAGNPDNKGNTENCLELWNDEWNDQKCENLQTFVCEIDVA